MRQSIQLREQQSDLASGTIITWFPQISNRHKPTNRKQLNNISERNTDVICRRARSSDQRGNVYRTSVTHTDNCSQCISLTEPNSTHYIEYIVGTPRHNKYKHTYVNRKSRKTIHNVNQNNISINKKDALQAQI